VAGDSAPEWYVSGNPAPNSPVVRTLEHDVAGLTVNNPYSGNNNEPVTNYLADPVEEAILHMVDADPARTPTLTLFAKPGYFLSSGSTTCPTSGCVSVNSSFAWDHGDYAAEINTNYVGFVGPGVRNLGLDGSDPADGPSSAGHNSGQTTVPGSGTTGTWVDETDIRPTLMYLTGLRDDYEQDGRVITPILAHPNAALSAPGVEQLAACYKQLNSSVGQFGTDTLIASTRGLESDTPGDIAYTHSEQTLRFLDQLRDAVASQMKSSLNAAAFAGHRVLLTAAQTALCNGLLQSADHLAQG
jgi:hypothetical protein